MNQRPSRKHIIIAPQIYVSLEPDASTHTHRDVQPRKTKIPMVWLQDGDNFRLDIELPLSSVLDVVMAAPVVSLHVNGETIWMNNSVHAVQMTGVHVEDTPDGLRLTCTSGGSIHILACIAAETVLSEDSHLPTREKR
jgi:hypothetical protein